MSKPLLLSLGQGKVQELIGTVDNQVPVWDSTLSEWKAEAVPGGGGGGGVTSVGLTGGTSGMVIGGAVSPITSAGTYTLDAPLRFAFNTATPTAVDTAGQVAWNDIEGSLESMLKGGNVKALVGQQIYQRAVNVDSVTLTKGMVVYVFGSSGTRISIKRAIATADLTSATILGVVAESITAGQSGFIITSGLLKDLSVLPPPFADGDVVYLSPTVPGGLTRTKPTAPDHLVMVGYVARASSGAAGELLVHPQNGYELGELHDVLISSPTSGQILIYDATAGQTRWENATPTGSSGVVVTPGAGSLAFSLDSAYAPTFLGLALSGLSASQFVKTDASKNLVSQQFVSLTTEVSETLPVGNGGTGKTTVTSGRLLLGAGASALTELAGTTSGDVVKWNGSAWTAGSVPAVTSVSTAVETGMGLTLTTANSTTTPVITLGGTLSAAKGGTGADLSGSSGVVVVSGGTFTARTITNGDVSNSAAIARSKLANGSAYRVLANDASGAMTDLGTGAAGQVLTSNGASALPTFQSIPYDLAGEAVGALTSGQTIFRFIAPRNITLSALAQGGGATATVKVQVAGSDVTLPGSVSVTSGQTVSVVTTSSGTDAYFTITGVVA